MFNQARVVCRPVAAPAGCFLCAFVRFLYFAFSWPCSQCSSGLFIQRSFEKFLPGFLALIPQPLLPQVEGGQSVFPLHLREWDPALLEG
jgi:hypothetical protein